LSDRKHPRLAFVDLETTGGTAAEDRITEVGIIEVDEDGVREWSSLVNPLMHIPEFIQSLTGISNAMVENAPTFVELADEIHARLADRVFIAHNARFDHGFLKNEFKRTGHEFRPAVLCTVRLSRKLFPGFTRHNLDSIAERHRLVVTERHRALGDAQLLLQFWKIIHETHTPEIIDETVSKLITRPAPPPKPDTPNVTSVGTTSEIGTLLQEAALIRNLMPAQSGNDEVCSWRLFTRNGKLQLTLAYPDQDLFFAHDPQLYGLFDNARQARDVLKSIVEAHSLCRVTLGLEKPCGGNGCAAAQKGKCLGACGDGEPIEAHNRRVMTALQDLRLQPWPYNGPIGIRENDAVHVIDAWAYLGTVNSAEQASALLKRGQHRFNRNVYQILQKRLPGLGGCIIVL
jgi:DNA polymerase-3 subunit epsilon